MDDVDTAVAQVLAHAERERKALRARRDSVAPDVLTKALNASYARTDRQWRLANERVVIRSFSTVK